MPFEGERRSTKPPNIFKGSRKEREGTLWLEGGLIEAGVLLRLSHKVKEIMTLQCYSLEKGTLRVLKLNVQVCQ